MLGTSGSRAAAVALLGIALLASGAPSASGARRATPLTPTVHAAALAPLGRLAFRWRGELWVAAGGSVHRLGMGAYPAWSPSGQFLAYLAGTGDGPAPLALARADGAIVPTDPSLTTSPGAYAWLPGDDRLVVAAADGELWLVSPSDGRVERVAGDVSDTGGPVVAPAGPDAVVVRRAHRTGNTVTGELDVQSLAGGAPRLIARVPGALLEPILVMGGRILYWMDPLGSASLAADGMGLASIPTEGGRPVLLATTLGHRGWVVPGPAGTVYAVAGPGRIAWAAKQLLRCSLATGRCLTIWSGQGLVPSDPAFDPATGRLAFVLARDLGPSTWGFRNPSDLEAWVRTRRLIVTDATGRHLRILPSPRGVYAPSWAADHRHLVVVGTSGIFAVDSASGRVTVLVSGLDVGAGDLFGFYGHRDVAADVAFAPVPSRP
jgi:hypothetical protein